MNRKKRDFASRVYSILEEEKQTLIENGYDPTNKISELKDEKQIADYSEIKQQD